MLCAGRLYHYTTLGALKFILPGRSALRQKGIDNKDTEFRFTQWNYLNDKEEGNIFIEFLRRRKKEIASKLEKDYCLCDALQKIDRYIELCENQKNQIEDRFSECFIFCGSFLRDSSQFWLSPYAKSFNDDGSELDKEKRGVCLSFDPYYIDRDFDEYRGYPNILEEKIDQNVIFYIDPYARKIDNCVDENFFEKIKNEIEGGYNFTSRFAFKYAGWKSEQEFRWMLWPRKDRIQYDSNAQKTPRARLYMCGVIDEIILGPGFGEEDIEYVQKDLMSRGYGIPVVLSKVKLQH